MSTINSKIVIEGFAGKWDFYVWADKGNSEEIQRIPGVANVSIWSGSGTQYYVRVDHRYDVQSVADEVVRRLS
jgi:hypothetical protein